MGGEQLVLEDLPRAEGPARRPFQDNNTTVSLANKPNINIIRFIV